jgi:shikimate kinase
MTCQGDISNIILVGMPGAGKSTIGVILAKSLGMGFVDTDILIQQAENRTLQEIVDSSGYMELRGIEERILLKLECCHYVIATGGSAVYSPEAMVHLKKKGMIVFLSVELSELQKRVSDFRFRGIARRPEQSFRDLFHERYELYVKYADVIVACRNRTMEQICERIRREFGRFTGLESDMNPVNLD